MQIFEKTRIAFIGTLSINKIKNRIRYLNGYGIGRDAVIAGVVGTAVKAQYSIGRDTVLGGTLYWDRHGIGR